MKPINLYDSLSQLKKPLAQPKITIYNCGPTVYHDIHLGNLRPVLIFDFLIRYLTATGYQVTYIHNITDIDDKIIARAAQLNCSANQLAEKYTLEYLKILDQMHLVAPDHLPKVSEYIGDIFNYINLLISRGYAYQINGDVLFSITKVPNYGVLSKQKKANLFENTRKITITDKHHPHDFFLWKKTNEGPAWSSPWSDGRPGWHTECACFIYQLVKDQLTIHGGGMDLKFPHHENENAQHWALTQQNLAAIWVHIGTLKINDQKMAKSLNNFILVKDLLNNYPPDVLRYFFMLTKYHQTQNFSYDQINQVQAALSSFWNAIHVARTHLIIDQQPLLQPSKINPRFTDAMNDDLNLPNVLSWLQQKKHDLNKAVKNKMIAKITTYLSELVTHFQILGFNVPNIHDQELIEQIEQWQKFLKNKDYQNADLIRAQLIAKKAW